MPAISGATGTLRLLGGAPVVFDRTHDTEAGLVQLQDAASRFQLEGSVSLEGTSIEGTFASQGEQGGFVAFLPTGGSACSTAGASPVHSATGVDPVRRGTELLGVVSSPGGLSGTLDGCVAGMPDAISLAMATGNRHGDRPDVGHQKRVRAGCRTAHDPTTGCANVAGGRQSEPQTCERTAASSAEESGVIELPAAGFSPCLALVRSEIPLAGARDRATRLRLSRRKGRMPLPQTGGLDRRAVGDPPQRSPEPSGTRSSSVQGSDRNRQRKQCTTRCSKVAPPRRRLVRRHEWNPGSRKARGGCLGPESGRSSFSWRHGEPLARADPWRIGTTPHHRIRVV